jgi:hypothetical protein
MEIRITTTLSTIKINAGKELFPGMDMFAAGGNRGGRPPFPFKYTLPQDEPEEDLELDFEEVIDRVSDALQRVGNLGIDSDADLPSYALADRCLENAELVHENSDLFGQSRIAQDRSMVDRSKILAQLDDLIDSAIRNPPSYRGKATQFAPPPKLKDPPRKKEIKADGYACVWSRQMQSFRLFKRLKLKHFLESNYLRKNQKRPYLVVGME